MSPRQFLPMFVAALFAAAPAIAEDDDERGLSYDIGNLSFNFTVDAATGVFHAANTGFGTGSTAVDANGRRRGTRNWIEYFIKPAVTAEYDLSGPGSLYARFSVIQAGTRHDGEAANPSPTAGHPKRTLVEDAAIGWKSGFVWADLGDNAVDISIGSQSFRIGDGFMILEGTANGGRRAASVLGPRTAFEQTAILRVNTRPVRADFFRLQAVVDQSLTSDSDNPHTEMVGGNLEWFDSSHKDHGRFEYEERSRYVGLTALHFTNADSSGGRNFSFEGGGNGSAAGANRDGLQVYSARLGGSVLPFLPDFSLYGEYGVQRNNAANRSVRAAAWYVEPQYTLSMLPWSPRIGYRYAHFSGDANPNDRTDRSWDQLFPGNGPRGMGTWTQGEIYGRYTGLANSNLNARQIHLRATPVEETLDLGVMLYRFEFDEPRQTAGVTGKGILDEVNIYAEWTTPVKGLAMTPVLGAARPRDGFRQQLGTADRNDRTLWLAQLIAAYRF